MKMDVTLLIKYLKRNSFLRMNQDF